MTPPELPSPFRRNTFDWRACVKEVDAIEALAAAKFGVWSRAQIFRYALQAVRIAEGALDTLLAADTAMGEPLEANWRSTKPMLPSKLETSQRKRKIEPGLLDVWELVGDATDSMVGIASLAEEVIPHHATAKDWATGRGVPSATDRHERFATQALRVVRAAAEAVVIARRIRARQAAERGAGV